MQTDEKSGTKENEEENAAIIDNIEVFTHNSIRIKSHIGTIYIDPFQMNENPNNADYILISFIRRADFR